ncbi:hypothetical protein E4T42_04186 [Aureobasidium subglaciale]|nr:hypothetical protein E4T38_04394 [Aureobasidium subglaciale]KAI5224157.1 hypothetical protein E4T40_04170 [Aureobasidium subglaciale]KAI5228353.1 hypothetical protein E4T41_03931 [Aureobasidium subglaciale]KAI5251528.1 hypothetical protein E4T42_04186 [Aureobasidium subglaciale]KAI5262846.1 hypothetical protein E4T46_04138 [Aureobasidium subglaciale]
MAPSQFFNPAEFVEDVALAELVRQYDITKILDGQKASFLETVMERLKHTTSELAHSLVAHDREIAYMQQKLNSLGRDGDCSSSSLESNPYVLVLIDGNELIFRNDFLSRGDNGGRRAAQALSQAINEYTFSTIDTLPINVKVVVRIYVDLEDLCSVSLRAGLVGHSSQIKTFVRGLCQDRPLFDLVDVGMQGHAVVFDKMEEHLRMNIADTHCKHILFGCEDGEIYAPILRRLPETLGNQRRITLLHGTQPDRWLAALGLACTQMQDIFRNTKVDTHMVVGHVPQADSLPALARGGVSPPSSSPTTSRSGSRTASGNSRPGVRQIHSRQISDSSDQSTDVLAVPGTPKIGSWAMAAKKGAAVKVPPKDTIKEKEQFPTDYVPRNKAGQRIDPPTPEFKKDEVNRLKKLKLCNAFHLRHGCPYPKGKCEHDHTYKCNPKEVETLKLVARMSACIHGSECSDVSCIYGHRCPFPESREGSMRGRACINGENCRFPAEMHNMDLTIVRRLKIT